MNRAPRSTRILASILLLVLLALALFEDRLELNRPAVFLVLLALAFVLVAWRFLV